MIRGLSWQAGLLALALFGLGSTGSAGMEGASTLLPPRLEGYISTVVRPSSSERKRLMNGNPLTTLLAGDNSKEVAVFGAVWINAPIGRYVEAVKDIEHLERGGGFLTTRRISATPRLEDFNDLHLRAKDLKDLRSCRIGDCIVKLDAQGIAELQAKVDWKARDAGAAVDGVMRHLAYKYVTGYLEGGNERLAVYRDSSRPTFVAAEFRSMVDEMPSLTTYLPNLRRYLLDYPKMELPSSTSFLYWQETSFGLRPTIRISHLTIREEPDETVVASKMLYASHYFWTALELRLLVPDPSRGPGFWFATISRSRSDGLSGFSGWFVGRRARSEAQRGTLAALQVTKDRLEQPGSRGL